MYSQKWQYFHMGSLFSPHHKCKFLFYAHITPEDDHIILNLHYLKNGKILQQVC